MRKLFITLCVLLVAVVYVPTALAAGSSVTVTKTAYTKGGSQLKALTFVCVGDDGNGTVADKEISNADAAFIDGWYFISVKAYPTSGGTAPDEADVLVFDEDGLDLLGSEDGATAYAGLTLIHATLPRMTLPNMYLPRAGSHINYYYPMTGGKLTLDVDNQGTSDAEWTIVLTFAR